MRLFSRVFSRQKKNIIIKVVMFVTTASILLEIQAFYSTDKIAVHGRLIEKTEKQKQNNSQISSISGKNHTYIQSQIVPNEDGEKDNFTTRNALEHELSDLEEYRGMKRQDKAFHQIEDSSDKVVFFIGGGKSGSTTLATYLKHDPNNWEVWDPHGQFLEGPKEICWSLTRQTKEQFWARFKTLGSKTAHFALDACPRSVERQNFEHMVSTFPRASYLMLVRDPVERVISHMNDQIDRGHMKADIDTLLKRQLIPGSLPVRLSMFGQILQNAYSVLPKDKIQIIPNSEMKKHPQETIDKVMKHIGASPKKINLVEANKRRDRTTYQIPSNTTIRWLQDMFHRDWELFKNISGLHIDTVYM